jgi:hypothetical protein
MDYLSFTQELHLYFFFLIILDSSLLFNDLDALDVAQDALNSRQVMLTRIVHVKAHLLNDVDNVWAHEGEVWRAPTRL